MAKILISGSKCERCGHEWVPRGEVGNSRVCPKCKSPYWDSPKRDYENFKDTIEKILRHSNKPLTWTEVRETADLPQKYPNNRWVYRMERDIGLVRERLTDGKTLWKLQMEKD